MPGRGVPKIKNAAEASAAFEGRKILQKEYSTDWKKSKGNFEAGDVKLLV